MKATITLVFSEFSSKKYYYPVQIDTPTNINDIAMQVSRQIMAAQAKKKRWSGKKEVSPGYNLLLKILPAALDKLGIEFILPGKLATKEQAFRLVHEANQNPPIEKIECPLCHGLGYDPDPDYGRPDCPACNGHGYLYEVMWQRVGRSPDDVLCMDIDNPDIANAKFLKAHLETMFGYPFNLNGSWHDSKLCSFQIIGSKRYLSKNEWTYNNCRILNQNLKKEDLKEYIEKLNEFDKFTKDKNLDWETEFKKTKLWDGWGDFDLMYQVISIKRGKSTLRISKKGDCDRYGLIE